jgi:hypothetical protein
MAYRDRRKCQSISSLGRLHLETKEWNKMVRLIPLHIALDSRYLLCVGSTGHRKAMKNEGRRDCSSSSKCGHLASSVLFCSLPLVAIFSLGFNRKS